MDNRLVGEQNLGIDDMYAAADEPSKISADPSIDQPAPADGDNSPPPEAKTFRTVHSASFPLLLERFGISVFVTTYQAGQLAVLRTDGGKLNMLHRVFPKPMGLAVRSNRLAIGLATEIREFHNVPPVAQQLDPASKDDGCYLPMTTNVTGDIQIHEMAWAGEELWFVNTAFSCLCTREYDCSFRPRWRPPFISHLAREDRCHLNGLAVADGRVRYVTALGETNEARGWRANKRDGGILIEVPSNRIIARGLSMPHSPRWHDGRLWLLESGDGTIGTVDLESGRYRAVARLPGYPRGLSFWGPFAFIGLSQIRESAIFSGIPLVERLKERSCGVWVVDVRTGEVAALLRFEDVVQEIFAVEVLAGTLCPDVITDKKKLPAGGFFILPQEDLADVSESMLAPPKVGQPSVPQS